MYMYTAYNVKFRVTLHGKGNKVKDGALNMALSPIAICGRVASYWRRGNNGNCALSAATKVTKLQKAEYHSFIPILIFICKIATFVAKTTEVESKYDRENFFVYKTL
ncbi:unnamed protein product [Arctia plantaginis]|uniref:Uncharacterized protein n=1 Tax=Arctia plantaginis TaxID=874455 RepID=A0A8S0ZUS5_ARCPL|nr:unnamed protein product [Arctia plantaginis]